VCGGGWGARAAPAQDAKRRRSWGVQSCITNSCATSGPPTPPNHTHGHHWQDTQKAYNLVARGAGSTLACTRGSMRGMQVSPHAFHPQTDTHTHAHTRTRTHAPWRHPGGAPVGGTRRSARRRRRRRGRAPACPSPSRWPARPLAPRECWGPPAEGAAAPWRPPWACPWQSASWTWCLIPGTERLCVRVGLEACGSGRSSTLRRLRPGERKQGLSTPACPLCTQQHTKMYNPAPEP
jgi:hypothetical protein